MTVYWKLIPVGTTPGEGPREEGPRGLLAEGFVRAHGGLEEFLASDDLHAALATTPAAGWEVVSFPGARVQPDPARGPGAVTVLAGAVTSREAPEPWLTALATPAGTVATMARGLLGALRAEPLSRTADASANAPADGPARAPDLHDVVTAAAVAKSFFDDFGQRNNWFSPTEDIADATVRVQYVADTRVEPDEIEVCFVASADTDPHGEEAAELVRRHLDALHAWDPRFSAWRFTTRVLA